MFRISERQLIEVQLRSEKYAFILLKNVCNI